MTLLVRNKEVAALIESSQGTWNTTLDTDGSINAANGANFYVINPTWKPTTLSQDRDIVTGSLTKLGQYYAGSSMGELSFGVEIAGNSGNPTDGSTAILEPPIGKLFRACGFEEVTDLVELTISAWGGSGTEVVHHGATLTGDDSGAVGTAFGYARNGMSDTVFVNVSSGTFTTDDDAVTISGSSATFNVSAVRSGTVYGYAPQSDPSSQETISLKLYTGGSAGRRLELFGGMGNVEFQFPHAGRPIAQFTFMAIIRDYLDGGPLGGQTIDQFTPVPNLGMCFKLDDLSNTWAGAVFSNLTVNMNNNVILRENSNVGGASTCDDVAWSYAQITDRSPSLSINVDEDIEASPGTNGGSFYYEAYEAGTQLLAQWQQGIDGEDDGNIWEYRCAGLQWNDLTEGNRDEVTTWEATGDLTGGNANNVTATDGEIVFINR